MGRRSVSKVAAKPSAQPIIPTEQRKAQYRKVSARGCKQKGSNFERECVAAFLERGVYAERVPLSGSAGGNYADDLRITLNQVVFPAECKIRARAWADLYGWLEGCGLLCIRANKQKPLIVMPLDKFAALFGEQW